VQRLAFGTLDYAVDLDLGGDEAPLETPSAQIAIASRAAGIGSPVAGVTPAIDDEPRLLADLAFARRYGFGAKLCIHPKQIAPIHRAFMPTDAEVDWARRVIAAAAASEGAVQVDGKMVDRPVLLKANAILARQSSQDRTSRA
jgi:citrate lyase subunit beta/citryl-CoA lyase